MDKRATEMKDTLQKRQPRYILLACVAVAMMAVHVWLVVVSGEDATWYQGFLSGFQFGLLAVLLVGSIIQWLCNRRAMRSEEKLLDLYIEEHDERTQAIEQRAGMRPGMVNGVVLLLVAIAAGYVNATVFFALAAAAVFTILMSRFRYAYYSKKL